MKALFTSLLCRKSFPAHSRSMAGLPVTVTAVREARDRVGKDVHCTPVHTSTFLDNLSGYKLHFKCENFQRTGSFKVSVCYNNVICTYCSIVVRLQIRGALNAVRNCTRPDPVIVTHSSGNHAQAVAMAAKLCGYEAHVVMPKASLEVKKQGVLDLGAKVSLCENYEQV